MKNIKDIFITDNISIKKAMKLLDKTAEKCLLVVDQDEKLLGTLTDGDIRRSILFDADFSKSIEQVFCKNPTVLKESEYSNEEATSFLKTKKLNLIPIIDKNSQPIDYITWNRIDNRVEDNSVLSGIPTVIMAGGEGNRLKPFTKVLPKALIPIHDKPIIEHIIDRFHQLGCDQFYLTVNYKQKILKAFFDELNPKYSVSFIDEDKPLGTAGSLKLINEIKTPFFVTNCDIIIKTDYSKIYEFHTKKKYDLTLVASTKEYEIPYGTCILNKEGYLSHINEKPKYDFLINTGLYILNPEILKFIPKNKSYHMTDLIEELKKNNKKIGVFPVDEDAWIDIGQWKEYKKSVELL